MEPAAVAVEPAELIQLLTAVLALMAGLGGIGVGAGAIVRWIFGQADKANERADAIQTKAIEYQDGVHTKAMSVLESQIAAASERDKQWATLFNQMSGVMDAHTTKSAQLYTEVEDANNRLMGVEEAVNLLPEAYKDLVATLKEDLAADRELIESNNRLAAAIAALQKALTTTPTVTIGVVP